MGTMSGAYPNGTTATYGYDGAKRITRIANMQGTSTVSSYDYTYDANGNRLTQIETNGGSAQTTTYQYDADDRLTDVLYPDADTSYTYDANYNRLTEKTVENATGATVVDKTYAYNTRNELTSVTDAANSANDATYQYDANGNQTVKSKNGTVTTFLYDVRDQLIAVRQDTTTLGQYQYDYAGLRVAKTGADGLVRYTYGGKSVLVQTDGTGKTLAKYNYGPQHLLSLDQVTQGRQYYLFDALGSTVDLTNPVGSVQARYQYDAWGNLRAHSGSSWNEFTYTGHEKDPATGLYYFKARYYDPDTGRFLSQDAYAGKTNNPPSLQKYLYAYANPTVYVDLWGYDPMRPLRGYDPNDVRGGFIGQYSLVYNPFVDYDPNAASRVLALGTMFATGVAASGIELGELGAGARALFTQPETTLLAAPATVSSLGYTLTETGAAVASGAPIPELYWHDAGAQEFAADLNLERQVARGYRTAQASARITEESNGMPAQFQRLGSSEASLQDLRIVGKVENAPRVPSDVPLVGDESAAGKAAAGEQGATTEEPIGNDTEENYVRFNRTHRESLPRPKGNGPNGGRLQSHHALQKEWAKDNLAQYGYDEDLAPTVTIETGRGHPHTTISRLQNARRANRIVAGQAKWGSSLQDELNYISSDMSAAGFKQSTIAKALEQQYRMLDKLKVPYQKIR